jgi:hypothetical protein
MGFGYSAPHKKDLFLTRTIYIVYNRPAKVARRVFMSAERAGKSKRRPLPGFGKRTPVSFDAVLCRILPVRFTFFHGVFFMACVSKCVSKRRHKKL